jgi:hypothetical protein
MRAFHVYVDTGADAPEPAWRGPFDRIISNSAEGAMWVLQHAYALEPGDRFMIVPMEPESIYDAPRDVTVVEMPRELRLYNTKAKS